MRVLSPLFALFFISCTAVAGVESDLKSMIGFTVVYAGSITDTAEKNYSEKYIQLDNGSVLKLDCMIFMPMRMTDVIVFGKNFPEDILKKYPNLKANFAIQIKLLIDSEFCDAIQLK